MEIEPPKSLPIVEMGLVVAGNCAEVGLASRPLVEVCAFSKVEDNVAISASSYDVEVVSIVIVEWTVMVRVDAEVDCVIFSDGSVNLVGAMGTSELAAIDFE